MKKQARFLFAAVVLCSIASTASAQVEVSTSLYYGSPYVWRGQVFSTGFVFQPTVSASYEGFSLTFFGNIDPRSGAVGNKLHLQEADLTAGYALSAGGVSLGAGYTLYTFPLPGEEELALQPTQEVYGSISLDEVPAAPSLYVAYDFDAIDGIYALASVGHDFSLGGQPLGLGAALGIDSNYLFEDQTGLAHLTFTASTDFSAGSITVSPLAAFQVSLDEAYEQQTLGYGYGETIFYGGIGISF